jgi:hypothetical protein
VDIWRKRLETGGVSSAVFSPRTWEERPEAKAQMMQRLAVHCNEALRLTGTYATPQTLPLLFETMREPVQLAYMIVGIQTEQNQPPAPESRLPPLEKTTTPAASLRGLFDAWKRVAVVKPRTVTETDYALKALVAFVGHDDAAKITRADLARWRDAMKAAGVTNNTWNNRLSMLRQVFAFGASEGTMNANPADGLRLRKSRQQSPLPYSDADASRILLACGPSGNAPVTTLGALANGVQWHEGGRGFAATRRRRATGR